MTTIKYTKLLRPAPLDTSQTDLILISSNKLSLVLHVFYVTGGSQAVPGAL